MENVYIVDFSDVLQRFRTEISNPSLPFIEPEVVQYPVMQMFRQVDPLSYLQRVAYDMIKDGDLYGRDDFYTEPECDVALAITEAEARQEERCMQQHLQDTILQLGYSMYQKLVDLRLIPTGHERYEVINRPFTNDTYLLKPSRN